MELEFEQARKLISSLEAQLADKNREVLALQTDLSAVQKDSIAALEELKSTDKLISTSLTSELERQREEYSFIMNERDALKSQLIEALLANDKLRKESDENKDLQDGTALSTDGDGSDAAKKAAEKVEKLRARLIQRNQVSDEPCWATYASCTINSRFPPATREVGTRKARASNEAQGSTAWGRLGRTKGRPYYTTVYDSILHDQRWLAVGQQQLFWSSTHIHLPTSLFMGTDKKACG